KDWIDQYNAEQDAKAKEEQQEYLDANDSHTDEDPAYPYSWTPMEILPDSLYELTIDGKEVSMPFDLTVPANERLAYADLDIYTGRFPKGHNYVLPFTITESSIDISNWKHLGLWFISSPFSGTYTDYSVKSGGLAPDLTGATISLSTIDQHTVEANGFLNYYSGSTTYHFLGDGSVEVTANSGGDLGAEVKESYSDPVTGEFYVKYEAAGAVIEETYKR
ncbi:MAG TPA: hypothetical protein VK031_03280, partial [Tissierellaceae bacterium]|nr:hypothetical protein [Tissierellaceae bacterium]